MKIVDKSHAGLIIIADQGCCSDMKYKIVIEKTATFMAPMFLSFPNVLLLLIQKRKRSSASGKL